MISLDPSILPSEYLICPNCRGPLVFSTTSSFYSCTKCGTKFPIKNGVINLLPTNLEANKLNEEKIWINHEMEGVDKPAWLALIHKSEEVKHFLNSVLPKHDFKGRVLEVGAGSCWASGLIKLNHPDSEVIASEVSYTALYKGIQVCKLFGSNVDYYVACDTERLPFKNELFDVVYDSAFLHHLLNPKKGISEIWRVLNNGGQFIATSEIMSNRILGYIWKRFGFPGMRERECGILENIYTLQEWSEFLRYSGFRDFTINIEKDWRYKTQHWFISLYYRAISSVPEYLVKKFLISSIGITAKK